jgi:hypothetical protein
MAIVHPINSAGAFDGDNAGSAFTIEGAYLDQSYYADELARDGVELTMVSVHRPLQDYTEALATAGFLIERLRRVPDDAIKASRSRRWQRLPLFLHLRALKL